MDRDHLVGGSYLQEGFSLLFPINIKLFRIAYPVNRPWLRLRYLVSYKMHYPMRQFPPYSSIPLFPSFPLFRGCALVSAGLRFSFSACYRCGVSRPWLAFFYFFLLCPFQECVPDPPKNLLLYAVLLPPIFHILQLHVFLPAGGRNLSMYFLFTF